MQRLSLVWEIATTQLKALPGAATKPLSGFARLRSNTLKIVATKTGTYSSRDNEVTLDSLSLEREKLALKVTQKFNDREIPLEFRNAVKEDILASQWATPTGTRDSFGKRKKTASLRTAFM